MGHLAAPPTHQLNLQNIKHKPSVPSQRTEDLDGGGSEGQHLETPAFCVLTSLITSFLMQILPDANSVGHTILEIALSVGTPELPAQQPALPPASQQSPKDNVQLQPALFPTVPSGNHKLKDTQS